MISFNYFVTRCLVVLLSYSEYSITTDKIVAGLASLTEEDMPPSDIITIVGYDPPTQLFLQACHTMYTKLKGEM